MSSDDFRKASTDLENIKDAPPNRVKALLKRLVDRFRDMDPIEREIMYERIENYANILTGGHSSIVTSALRQLRDLYHDIVG